MTTETELKLTIPPGSARKTQRLPWLQKLAKDPIAREELSSTYFDTKKLKLLKHGVTLRVRKSGSKRVQTIKGLAGSGLGRAEREDNIKSARPQLKYAKGTPLAPFVTKKLKRTLGPVFRTDVRRSILNVQLNGGNIEVAFDQGKIVAGRHAEPISEIELELKQGRAEDIAELARKLRANVPLSFGARTKADRGYALKAGKVDEPVYAAPVSLKPEQSAGSAFTQIGLSCLQHLAANERGVRAGDAEGIHQMRVGLRRLRAAISIFGDIVRGRDTDALKQELKWLTEELGPARDLDVLAKEAVAPLREANPDRPSRP
jgi:triphosphatase